MKAQYPSPVEYRKRKVALISGKTQHPPSPSPSRSELATRLLSGQSHISSLELTCSSLVFPYRYHWTGWVSPRLFELCHRALGGAEGGTKRREGSMGKHASGRSGHPSRPVPTTFAHSNLVSPADPTSPSSSSPRVTRFTGQSFLLSSSSASGLG